MQRLIPLFATLALLAVTGCDIPPRQNDAVTRGTPERLLDVSSEVVNLGVRSGKEIDDLAQWINRDQPTRAELYCAEGEKNCREARQVLELYGVPMQIINSQAGTITLVYERILARDCEHRYVEGFDNWHNEHEPNFGCSVSANIVQHVTMKQQFISPNLSDFRDAEGAVNGYVRYQRAAGGAVQATQQQGASEQSLLSSVSSQ